MDWHDRYARDDTPWDMGRPHPELARRLEAGLLAPGDAPRRALVPGCGKGHDALALAAAGFVVTAVDLVASLGERLQAALAGHGGRFLCADALALRAPHDLLFEHTFFCALPPALRAHYGGMAAACVAPGGELHAIVFPVDKQPRGEGPPFQMTTDDLTAALGSSFELHEDAPIEAVAGRGWASRWARFRRRE